MASSFEFVIRRIEWLEKAVGELFRRLARLQDALDELPLELARARREAGSGTRLVVILPDGAVDAATYVPAVPYDAGPPEVPYVPPRIVPASGTGRIWQTYDGATGELRARQTIRRWDAEAEPPAPYDVDATVAYDNVNPREGIPADALYAICMEQGGRLIAIVWDCGEGV